MPCRDAATILCWASGCGRAVAYLDGIKRRQHLDWILEKWIIFTDDVDDDGWDIVQWDELYGSHECVERNSKYCWYFWDTWRFIAYGS
jgi:hypothetical protein